jgi:lysine-N-methylase
MKLPVILPDLAAQRYECHGCTNCCRDLVVHLTAVDRQKIDRQDWPVRLGCPPYVRLGASFVLSHKPGGGCVFLNDAGRCRIHAEYGATEKPLACQLYPFTLEPQLGTIRTGIRFDCPSVAANKGKPISEHKPEVSRLAAELQQAAPGQFEGESKPIELVQGRPLPAAALDSLVERLDAWLRDDARSVDDRLVGLLDWVETLSAARLDRLHDEQLRDLIGMLADDLPQAVQAARDARAAPPNRRQLKLFRQAVFAHCEHVTLEQALAPFFARMRGRLYQLVRGRRLAAGAGPLPALLRGRSNDRGATFEEVERCGLADEPEASLCDEALNRHLRARLLSRVAFGGGYYGWPVLDGLAALLLAVPIVGWLARYLAVVAGRESCGREDIAAAIGVVDRNAGRVPELGSTVARLRLRYLRQDQGLLRLMRSYPLTKGGAEKD